jgi:NADPH:quinone reductase-like Zn-dependent oxidoreductase
MLRSRAARRKGRHRRCSLQKGLADSISGSLPPIIDKAFPLLSAADAHRRIEAGDHIGKIVLKVGLA